MSFEFIFHAKTTIIQYEDVSIPMNRHSLMNSDEVMKNNGECDYLIDIMGVITGMSTEKVSAKEGKNKAYCFGVG
ncbi:hypothetical protein E2542_SST08381 [Spatholobus suberectus]|nr:hypothetical protein E2542_SST08381 [Spatholobus suberectus]